MRKKCPECDSTHVVRNGFALYKRWGRGGKRVEVRKQKFVCRGCGRQFVEQREVSK